MRMLSALVAVLILLATQIGPATAGMVVLDFQSLESADALLHDQGKFYSEDGFTLEADPSEPGNAEIFRTAGTLDPLYPGSTALFHGGSNGEIILTADDGQPFDLLSIALAELPPGRLDPNGPSNSGPFDVTFFGMQAGGGTVAQTFTVDGFLTLKPYTFSGFTNLVEVNWFQGAGGPSSPTHQFDDITITTVPVPTGILLGFSGLLAMWTTAFRTRGRQSTCVTRPTWPRSSKALARTISKSLNVAGQGT